MFTTITFENEYKVLQILQYKNILRSSLRKPYQQKTQT